MVFQWWRRLTPRTRRRVRKTTKAIGFLGLAGTAVYGLAFAYSKFAEVYTLRRRDGIEHVGERYALQKIAGCEVIREVNPDGSIGYVYDIPRGPHLDLGYSPVDGRQHAHKEDPRGLVLVVNANGLNVCDVVSQPEMPRGRIYPRR